MESVAFPAVDGTRDEGTGSISSAMAKAKAGGKSKMRGFFAALRMTSGRGAICGRLDDKV
jgi:hypothetical protein